MVLSLANIKGKIDFEGSEMLEIFLNRRYRQDLFHKGLPPNRLGPPGKTLAVAFFGIDLPDPACIPITGRSDKDIRMKVPELKRCKTSISPVFHL